MFERILELLKEKNLTPAQFADAIGIQRSGMSHLISGRNKPSLEFILKVLKRFPDVKADYLLYGANEPGLNTKDEIGNDKENTPKISPTLFDQSELVDSKPEPKPLRQIKKEKTERKVEKIVVFYDDRTFKEYEPE